MREVAARLTPKQGRVPDPFPDYEGLEERLTPDEIERRLDASPLVTRVAAPPGGDALQ